MIRRFLIATLAFALVAAPLSAQVDDDADGAADAPATQSADAPASQPAAKVPDVTAEQYKAMTPQQRAVTLRRVQLAVARAAMRKDLGSAESAARKLVELVPEQGSFHYALAGMLALQHKDEAAVDALADAVARGYNDAYQVSRATAFKRYADDARFKGLLEKMRASAKADADKRYQKPGKLKGVKIVEGDPDDGLRWRLYLSPDADKDHPRRMAVWLHPAGASGNAQVEKLLVPLLIRHGYCLLLPTAKDWRNWSRSDARKLFAVSAPAAAKTPGVDGKRPLLIGYSAGGQLAMLLWRSAPQKYSGVVLNSAFPVQQIRRSKGGRTNVSIFLPPDKAGVKKVPFFVLVGEREGGLLIWTEAESRWRARGVPLTIEVVKGAGHEWLFGGVQRRKLGKWLDAISAGKLPGAPTSQPESAPDAPPDVEEIF